jgi:hypothetical protein
VIAGNSLSADVEDRLIKDIYMIVDGSVIFHRSYEKSTKEPALISGFIGAIASFAREITSTGVLKKVLIPPVKFMASQIMEQPQVIVAILVSERFPDDLSEELLQFISELILGRHIAEVIDSRGEDLSIDISKDVHEIVLKTMRRYIEKKMAHGKQN